MTSRKSSMLKKRRVSSSGNSLRTLVRENNRLRRAAARADQRKRLLESVADHLHSILDLNELIARIFDEVNAAIHAEAQSIWLLDDDRTNITCRFATGPGADQVVRVVVAFGEGIVGTTVARHESIRVDDVRNDVRHSRRAQEKTGVVTRSLLSVPLVCSGRAIGAIQAINKQTESGDFTDTDLDLLRCIADTAALCVENARLFADLEASYDTTLEALAAALDARDRETEGHSRRVVAYATRFAEAIGMNAVDIRRLRRGALIHDLGKIGVPDAILRKPGALTREEWDVMVQHPEIGFTMLRGISHLRDELDIVRAHHERWDGTGYPLGIAHQEIPVAARVFAIIDAYDAITSERHYRPAGTHAEAIEVLESNAGTQFDPDLVGQFVKLPQSELAALREATALGTEHATAAPFRW